jgi:hypothetical protein
MPTLSICMMKNIFPISEKNNGHFTRRLHAFVSAKMTGWGIPTQEIPRKFTDISPISENNNGHFTRRLHVFVSAEMTGWGIPTQEIPRKFTDVKSQTWRSARIVTPRIYFSTCFNYAYYPFILKRQNCHVVSCCERLIRSQCY